ncbi:MAG: hypothetical protein JWO97_3258 [Acidobacteria bacterium]|nr:hypothetical protein [Acidobacteriota bacterium]
MKRTGFLLAILLLLSTALPAQSDVPVSSVTHGNAPGDQIAPAVASDGTNFLAVWSDARSPLGGLYATRIDFRGQILDETGIRIGGSAGSGAEVVWSGSSYVIVWSETSFATSSGPKYTIRVARIDASGALIEAPRTLREDAFGYPRNVATNGSRIIVAYAADVSKAPRISYAVLDRDARTIALDVAVPQPSANNYAATVTSNGSDFLMVWTSTNGLPNSLPAAHIDASGNVAGNAILAQALSPADGPLVASDGTDFLVFTRALTSSSDELQVMRVGANLNVIRDLHPAGVPSDVTVQQPRVVWNGNTYLLVWADAPLQAIRAQHLGRDGTALDQPAVLAGWQTSGLVGYPNLASNGGGVLLVWNDSRFSVNPLTDINYDVMSRLIDTTILIANPERLVSSSAPRQTSPSIATGAGVTMTVWSEDSGVYASRVTPSGALDGRGIQLSTSGRAPHIIFDGTNFLAAWIVRSGNSSSIGTARIDPAGHLLDAHTVANGCVAGLTLTHGASSSLLAWLNCTTGAIDAIRVGNSGDAIDALPLTLTPSNILAGNLSAAWNGSEYLVTWDERVEVPSIILFPVFRTNLYATRVSGSLTLIDSQPIAIAVSNDDAVSNGDASVASDGEDFLVTWTGPNGIAAAHVSASGIVAGSTPLIAGGASSQVVWDGVRYLVARRDGTTIVAAHIDGPGIALANDRFTIAETLLSSPGLDLTQTASGRVTAIYTRVATEPQVGNVERAFVRALPVVRGRVSRR